VKTEILSVLQLQETQSELLANLSASHSALERLVLALIDSHPDKAAVLARFEQSIDADTIRHLYGPDSSRVCEAGGSLLQRFFTAVRRR
jgi:hypothetical protein